MELGKLVPTNGEKNGQIFYGTLDDVYPDEPRAEHLHTFYVVTAEPSSSFSHVDAYCFMGQALCDVQNAQQVRRWYVLFERIFGATPFEKFESRLRLNARMDSGGHRSDAAPPKNGSRRRSTTVALESSSDGTRPLPRLYRDEASARLALQELAKKAEIKHEHRQEQLYSGGQEHTSSTPPRQQKAPVVKNAAPAIPSSSMLTNEHQFYRDGQLDRLLMMATRWEKDSAVVVELRREIEKLWEELEHERALRKRAELEKNDLWNDNIQQEGRRNKSPTGEKNVVHTNTAVPAESYAPAAYLEVELEAARQNLLLEQKRRISETAQLRCEMEQLEKRLWDWSRGQGSQLHALVKENAVVVQRMEDGWSRQEKELISIHTKALEERDVHVARLSEELQQTRQQLHLALKERNDFESQYRAVEESRRVEMAHWEEQHRTLKKIVATLSQESQYSCVDTASMQRYNQPFAHAYGHGTKDITQAFMTEQNYSILQEECTALRRKLQHAEENIDAARQLVEKKENELHRASQLIDLLKEGLIKVKTELPMLHPPGMVGVEQKA